MTESPKCHVLNDPEFAAANRAPFMVYVKSRVYGHTKTQSAISAFPLLLRIEDEHVEEKGWCEQWIVDKILAERVQALDANPWVRAAMETELSKVDYGEVWTRARTTHALIELVTDDRTSPETKLAAIESLRRLSDADRETKELAAGVLAKAGARH